MSYTCGGATSHDIAMVQTQAGSSGTSCLVAGWWKPTTLTATRGLWSYGNIFGAEIDTTTSELRLRTDNTTDGQWTTTGAGLAVNEWRFLAFANTCNSVGPTAAWVVWSGTISTIPTQLTVTQATAPVGAFTGSTAATLGNKGTSTLAFQGELGPALFVRNSSDTIGIVPTATVGAFSQEEIDLMYARIVLPVWSGEWCPPWLRNPRQGNSLASVMYATSMDYAGPQEVDILTGASGTPYGAMTLNGVTLSQERCPRPMPQQAIQPEYVRRR